ncbi:hypothetical protein M569_02151, partial [Genlisea aurea]
EAVRCLNIAKEAIKSGDNVRSRKFLEKARRLNPSINVDDHLSDLDSSQQGNDRNSDHNDHPIPPQAQSTPPRHRVSGSPSPAAAYSQEQMDLIKQIKRKKDYYDILGLDKKCSNEDIPRAYRKLSLKVHPDKNPAPGAEEAFKQVSKAFKCLSDEESRKRYDLVGSEEPGYGRQGGGGSNVPQGFNGFYDVDIDADEIFRNFFYGGGGGGFTFGTGGGGGVRVRTGGGGSQPQGGSNWPRALIPVALVLLMNFLPSGDPVYSLSASYSYDYRFTTEKGVNFYVKSSSKFEQQYPGGSSERVGLEQRIHEDYRSALLQNCRVEWQQLHWGYRKDTPNCDAVKRFEA